MPLDQAENYIAQMLTGLEHMHHTEARQTKESLQGSFIHRDIKPENSESPRGEL